MSHFRVEEEETEERKNVDQSSSSSYFTFFLLLAINGFEASREVVWTRCLTDVVVVMSLPGNGFIPFYTSSSSSSSTASTNFLWQRRSALKDNWDVSGGPKMRRFSVLFSKMETTKAIFRPTLYDSNVTRQNTSI